MKRKIMNDKNKIFLKQLINREIPDQNGRYGKFGGQYAPETLMPALKNLDESIRQYLNDESFQKELAEELHQWAGRPTGLTFAKTTSELWGAQVYLKREDLTHTGAHKINNALGQALLAKKIGAKRVVAETGAGQHGVATAMACSCLGLPSEVYMGYRDTVRQQQNVFRMDLLGCKVYPVKSGSQTLKDAINEAIRDWITNVETTYYLLGSAVGPHPYPVMVRDFQSVIGKEIKKQMKNVPDTVIACVGGGSNAIGTFYPMIGNGVEMIGVEAAGQGLKTGRHSATLNAGKKGVLHGMMTYLLQDDDGQIKETHSISAGLDYPGVGPEHAFLKDVGNVKYKSATDREVINAFLTLTKTEGIIPALESAHAISHAMKIAKTRSKSDSIVVTLSGRGDKDIDIVKQYLRKNVKNSR